MLVSMSGTVAERRGPRERREVGIGNIDKSREMYGTKETVEESNESVAGKRGTMPKKIRERAGVRADF